MAGSNVVICVLALVRLHLVLSDECRQFNTVFGSSPFQLAYMTTESDELLANTGNFTICFWMKPTFDNEEWTTFSYESFPSTKYGNEITVGFENIEGKSKLIVGGSVTVLPMPEISLNVWMHVCVLYDGSHPKVTFIYNGDEKFEEPGNASMINYEIPGRGKVVVGQDQDTYGGSFESRQSMKGELSRLQMWNRLLNDAEVKEQMQCNATEGNLIAWTDTPWQFRNGAVKDVPASCRSMPPACSGEGSSDDENEEKYDEWRDWMVTFYNRNYFPEHDDVLFHPEQRVATPDLREEYPEQPTKKKKSHNRQQTSEVEALKEPAPINYKKLRFFQRIVKTETEMLIEYSGQQPPRKLQLKASSVCPTEFTKIAGNCYYFSTETEDWNGAVKKCRTMEPQSSLLKLETRVEWNALKQFINDSEVLSPKFWWMHGTDQDREGYWKWGRTGQPFTFDDWCKPQQTINYNQQPDNSGGNENCAHIRKLVDSLCWNDLPCRPDVRWNFICEM